MLYTITLNACENNISYLVTENCLPHTGNG